MADKKISELTSIVGADTAPDDFFVVVDSSGSVTKKISRAELNNAIEQDVLAQVDITSANIDGGTIDNTPIGSTTASTGNFTTVDTTGNVTVGGNLTVNGTTTTVNSTTLDVDDINITVASGAASAAAADGAGLTVDGASATFNYASTGDKWTMNKPLDVSGTVTMTGATTTGDINFGDNDKATFGDAVGGDLRIYHDGTHSYVSDQGSGNLYLESASYLVFRTANGNEKYLVAQENGPVTLYYDNNAKLATSATGAVITGVLTADGLTVDTTGIVYSGGNVGIGVSTASGKLHLSESGATNQAATIFSLDGYHSTFGANLAKSSGTYTTPAVSLSGGGWEYQPVNSLNNHGVMIYLSAPDTNTSASTPLERLRIDGSGNLLAGKTSASVANDGIQLEASGTLGVTRANDDVAIFNRKSSDGNIAVFRKDNTTVGSIGTTGGHMWFGCDDVGMLFRTNESIRPYNPSTTSERDAAIDLGVGASRFKDLYLSGGVYLGGVGSANLLDDYEEGSFSPSLGAVSTSTNAGSANYVKIGDMVFCRGYIAWTGLNTGDGSAFQFTLPFAPNLTDDNASGNSAVQVSMNTKETTGLTGILADVLGARIVSSGVVALTGAETDITYNSGVDASGEFHFHISYRAT